MTEYDYTPEAFERHRSTQDRIARWVSQTEEHRPQFDSVESRKPSFFQRLTQRRKSHSYHGPRYRRDSSSSSSSSSSSTTPYSASPRAPGPMPYAGHQPPYQPPQASPHRPPHSRHDSSRHHSSSYRAPVYLASPPTTPQVQVYPYPYGALTSPGQASSGPGPYVYPARPGVSSAGSPAYHQSTTSYFPQNVTYPMYGQRSHIYQPPQTAYQYYGQAQSQPFASPPAQYPHTAVYPPAIYPLTGYEAQQQPQASPKPVFYQRFFTKKEKHRRSY